MSVIKPVLNPRAPRPARTAVRNAAFTMVRLALHTRRAFWQCVLIIMIFAYNAHSSGAAVREHAIAARGVAPGGCPRRMPPADAPGGCLHPTGEGA